MSAAVAAAAMDAGADIINDVSGLSGDPEMARVAADTGAGVVLMHMQGLPRTMQHDPSYTAVVPEVSGYLASQRDASLAAGIRDEAIIYDPGIGFGKNLEHNLSLLRAGASVAPAGRPTLWGVSRKSFIGKILGSTDMDDRLWAGIGLTSWGRERGIRVFRVHDVSPHAEALRMTEAILSAEGRAPAEADQ
jgi:dihydropteroate synthase